MRHPARPGVLVYWRRMISKNVIAIVVAVVGSMAIMCMVLRLGSGPVERVGPAAAGDARCDAEAYGMDCRIVEHLEDKLAFVSRGGIAFCSYHLFGPEENGVLYLHAVCEERYTDDGRLRTGAGLSVPVRLTRRADGSFLHWVPGDGRAFSVDMKANFPEAYRVADSAVNVYRLTSVNGERAERAMQAEAGYSIEKVTDRPCVNVLDCETPVEFMFQSRCPFASKCIEGKCAVICPDL